MKEKTIVLFDLGNVLVKPFQIEYLYQDLNLNIEYEQFREYWSNSFDAKELHKGNITLEEYIKRLSKFVKKDISFDEFRNIYDKNKRILFPNTLELINELKDKNIEVGLLSNLREIDWFEVNKYNDTSFFNYLFLSYEMHLLKPDSQIYKEVINKLNINPQYIYFFDDVLDNVKSAQELGIKAYCVTGNNIKEKIKEYKINF